MSWATDVYYIMTNDSSLNTSTGGVYFEHLPDDANSENDYIVYTYRKDNEINVLRQKNVMSEHTLYVIVISESPSRLASLSDYISEYLNNVDRYGGIKDIYFLTDNRTKELDEDIYQNTLEFRAIYVK